MPISCKLSGDSSILGEHFYIFCGFGSNGKSQFLKLISEVFGDYYLSANNKLFKVPFRDPNTVSSHIAILKSKRIVILPESKDSSPFESDKLNELINCDPLTSLDLNKKPIQFLPQYSVFFECNDIPRTESLTDGFFDKILIIPFESKFITNNEELYKLDNPIKYSNHFKAINQIDLYKTWAPYFLYLLFQRYIELKENSFKFSVPEKIKAATRQYQEEASPYIQFYNDKIEEADGFKVNADLLYQEFKQFVGRDFKTQKPTFLKQIERLIGKPEGKNKEYLGFRIFGTTGQPI